MHVYGSLRRSAMRADCTTGKERWVRRWEHEEILERLHARLEKRPKQMTVRGRTVEHVFGTMKHWMGSTHFPDSPTEQLEHADDSPGACLQPQASVEHLGYVQNHESNGTGRGMSLFAWLAVLIKTLESTHILISASKRPA